MSLTLSDVKRIAHLAQLEMADDQAVTSLAQLNKIFALAEQMQAVNTDGVRWFNSDETPTYKIADLYEADDEWEKILDERKAERERKAGTRRRSVA